MTEHYLGIDVGYSERKPTTGLCLITLEQDQFSWECLITSANERKRTQDLRSLMSGGKTLHGVGIDGPLRPDLGPVDHYRSADALLSGGKNFIFKHRCQPASTANYGNLHDHATRLAKLVLGLQPNSLIVEAFPNAFLAFLLEDESFPPRDQMDRAQSDIYWEIAVRHPFQDDLQGLIECPDLGSLPDITRMLTDHLTARRYSRLRALIEHLSPGKYLSRPLENVTSHDHRAAFVCALTAMCAAKNKYVAAGDPKYGDFVLPPVKAWGRGSHGYASWVEEPLRLKVVSVHNQQRHPSHRCARVLSNGKPWMLGADH